MQSDHLSERPESVNPDVREEVKKLLKIFYKIKGEGIESGQDNYPGTTSPSTYEAKPILWK